MTGHRAAWLVVATVATVVSTSTCTKHDTPAVQNEPALQKELALGPHRVLVSPPAGWEVLDQGAQKRFRKGEADIVLENLGRVDWEAALASMHDKERREVKSRREMTIDNREAVEIETWNRLDHAWPQRLLLVRADEDLLALHTTRLADPDTAKAFESIRESLHFIAIVRR